MSEPIDRVAMFRLRLSALTTENQNLTASNIGLKNQCDSLISSREEDQEKCRENIQNLYDANKKLLDEQLARFTSELNALKEAYAANSQRLLDALDEAYKARTQAQMDADSWKTKFNEYLKSSLR